MARAALCNEDIQDFRERAVEVAERLFAANGYEGVTFRALAQGLGCSAMTPYRYFSGKEEIFACVRAAAHDRFAEALEATENRLGSAGEDRLTRIGHAYVRFALNSPDDYQLMFALRQADPDSYPALRAAEQRSWEPLLSAVAAAVEAGELAGDVEEIAHICWASIHGLVSLHLSGKLVLSSLNLLVDPMLRTAIEGNRSSTARGGDQ
jgi:AcrR family transcriptional regulator